MDIEGLFTELTMYKKSFFSTKIDLGQYLRPYIMFVCFRF